MKILYYDCFAGISGDMHLGAMIDAGVDPDHLLSELKKLPLTGYKLHISRDQRKSIEGTRVDVILDGEHKGHNNHHNHDHDHSHGHSDHRENHNQDRDQSESHKHGHHHHHHHDDHHDHDHDNEHDHHHNHEHRNLSDINEILVSSTLPEKTINRALKMFRLIAEAEAKIHGVTIDEIHFHEVGAVDSIVDITGAAICLEYLNPDRIYCSTIELGTGTVRCAHGRMPVPAPATSEILKGIPVKTGSTPHEATTPSGAAILAANVDEFTDSLRFQPKITAYGIGQRDMELPNILRVFVGEIDDKPVQAGEAILIECNIDDMNPEHYSHVMDRLFSNGVYDVYVTPILMKKSRPAAILSVLCDEMDQQEVFEILFKETTTLGIRIQPVSRLMLDRTSEKAETSLGTVTIKKAFYKGKLIKWKPEYEDCKKLAHDHQLSIQEVSKIIEAEITTLNKKHYETIGLGDSSK